MVENVTLLLSDIFRQLKKGTQAFNVCSNEPLSSYPGTIGWM